LVLFTGYSNLPKFPVWGPTINQNAQKARVLTGSTFGFYSRFRSGLKIKGRLLTLSGYI